MLTLETAPSVMPFSLSDLKDQLRIDTDADDKHLNELAHDAVAFLEGKNALRRALITQSWAQWVKNPTEVRVEMTPFQSLTSVQYYDAAGSLQTATLANFEAVGTDDKVWIRPKDGYSWPASEDRPDAIKITYQAGYGDAASDVPRSIRRAIALLVAHWYERREVVDRDTAEIPYGLTALIDMERARWYG